MRLGSPVSSFSYSTCAYVRTATFPMKILTVVGARPQFIKAAVVSRLLAAQSQCTEVLIHTGQHYDERMSDVFFRELSIPVPTANLAIGSGSHGAQTAQMLIGIEQELQKHRPDLCLIYGDTNSTLAGALAAAKLHIPVAHVEAGLRSFNKRMPEEINRITADHCSTLLFSASPVSTANLLREGIAQAQIVEAGDVMYDATLFYLDGAVNHQDVLCRLGLEEKSYALATLHRAENTDDPRRLCAIFDALLRVAEHYAVVLPLHPRTVAALQRQAIAAEVRTRLRIIEPVGYLEMLALERSAAVVATDSGGVQKEAYYAGTPCVTLRDETEWVELVELGFNSLCSPTVGAQRMAEVILEAKEQCTALAKDVSLYGGGRAGERIVEALAGFAGR
ncbi:MAG: UDP-N-acetylglucosamine 2-epimerase (non-hydrolyzing) [Bdellovibrionales bacterium]|nr:UDP-N-acetylglucosamine 2-epimerase (non-hydrolyzing) [Bdellovibrionales bacterium]